MGVHNYIQSMKRTIDPYACNYFYDNHDFFHIQKANYVQVTSLLFPESSDVGSDDGFCQSGHSYRHHGSLEHTNMTAERQTRLA